MLLPGKINGCSKYTDRRVASSGSGYRLKNIATAAVRVRTCNLS